MMLCPAATLWLLDALLPQLLAMPCAWSRAQLLYAAALLLKLPQH